MLCNFRVALVVEVCCGALLSVSMARKKEGGRMYLRKSLKHVAGASELLYALAEILDGLLGYCSTCMQVREGRETWMRRGINSRIRLSLFREYFPLIFL